MANEFEIVYKQGDGDVNAHDWYYEGAAAIVIMQGHSVRTRDAEAAGRYLPKMARACDFIEGTRDPETDLFLVGAAANLLAPSYAGMRNPDGTFGKAYLAGLSVTYTAALERMAALYEFVGDGEKKALYEGRWRGPGVPAQARDRRGLLRQVAGERRHAARRGWPGTFWIF